jgi:hypothetical protein
VDSHTLLLYHFDETSGAISSSASPLNLTDVHGDYGRGSYSGFHRAFNFWDQFYSARAATTTEMSFADFQVISGQFRNVLVYV